MGCSESSQNTNQSQEPVFNAQGVAITQQQSGDGHYKKQVRPRSSKSMQYPMNIAKQIAETKKAEKPLEVISDLSEIFFKQEGDHPKKQITIDFVLSTISMKQSEFKGTLEALISRLLEKLAAQAFSAYCSRKITQPQMRIFFSKNLVLNVTLIATFISQNYEKWDTQRKNIMNSIFECQEKVLKQLLKKYPQKKETPMDQQLVNFLSFPENLKIYKQERFSIVKNLNFEFVKQPSGRYQKPVKQFINQLISVSAQNFESFKEQMTKIFTLESGEVLENKIGKKINPKTPAYQPLQIDQKGVKIKGSEILRIIMKWIECLEQLLGKDLPETSDADFLRGVESYLVEFNENCDKLTEGNNCKISQLSSCAITEITSNLATNYLSKLIDKLLSKNSRVQFNVFDLLRCKCQGTKHEMKEIYNNLQNSEMFEIIRVKNRLNTGNKDFLINFHLKETPIICEIQIGIKAELNQEDKTEQMKDHFNHYIYQLCRSKYGPTEEASLLNSHTNPAVFQMRDKYEKFEKQLPVSKITEKASLNDKLQIELEGYIAVQPNLVFICKNCQRIKRPSKKIVKIFKRKGAEHTICCGSCVMAQLPISDKFNFLIHTKLADFSQISMEQLNSFADEKIKELGNTETQAAASLWLNMYQVYKSKSNFKKAQEMVTKALQIFKKVKGEQDQKVGQCYISLGNLYHTQQKTEQAKTYYEKSLNIFKGKNSEKNAQVADAYNNLGLIYYAKRNLALSEQYHNKALSIKTQLFGKSSIQVAPIFINIGNIYQLQLAFAKARSNFQKALEIYLGVLGENHSSTASAYNNIGMTYHQQGYYPEAIDFYTKGLEVYLNTLGESNKSVAMSHFNLGLVHHALRKYSLALQHHTQALNLWIKLVGEKSNSTALSYFSLGSIYKQNFNPQSKQYFEKAYQIWLQLFGPNYENTKLALANSRGGGGFLF